MEDKARLEKAKDTRSSRRLIAVSLAIMTLLLLILIPLASTYPDALERLSENLGFTGSQPIWSGLFPDYTAPVGGSWLGTLFIGIIGAIIVLATILVAGRIMTPRRMK